MSESCQQFGGQSSGQMLFPQPSSDALVSADLARNLGLFCSDYGSQLQGSFEVADTISDVALRTCKEEYEKKLQIQKAEAERERKAAGEIASALEARMQQELWECAEERKKNKMLEEALQAQIAENMELRLALQNSTHPPQACGRQPDGHVDELLQGGRVPASTQAVRSMAVQRLLPQTMATGGKILYANGAFTD